MKKASPSAFKKVSRKPETPGTGRKKEGKSNFSPGKEGREGMSPGGGSGRLANAAEKGRKKSPAG